MRRFRPEEEAGILAAIIESSDDAIFTKDLEGLILSWNPAAERLYGYNAEEVLGRSTSVLLPADRRDELATILERITGGQRVEWHETVRQAKNGRLIEVSLTVSPIRDAAGHVIAAAAIARDLTARKRAEARWRSIIESAVDGIVVIDARGSIEAFNPGAERLFGYAEREVVGRNVNLLMPSPYHE